MNIGASNFVLATALLAQGPNACGEVLNARPELASDDEEGRGFLMAAGGLASQLTLADLARLGEGGRDIRDLHAKIRTLASSTTKQTGCDQSFHIRAILIELARMPDPRFHEIAAKARAAGLSLFGNPQQVLQKARRQIGSALSPADDLTADPEVGDERLLLEARNERLVQKVMDPWHGDREEKEKALWRLIRLTAAGDRFANSLVERILGAKGEEDSPEPIDYFTKEHVAFLEERRSCLDEGGILRKNLRDILAVLHEFRPELFSD